MRPSEYLGLTWNDLDLDCGTVSVSHMLECEKVVGSSLKRSGPEVAAW
jgi:hypothetical protein